MKKKISEKYQGWLRPFSRTAYGGVMKKEAFWTLQPSPARNVQPSLVNVESKIKKMQIGILK